jgi:hypothetical protein
MSIRRSARVLLVFALLGALTAISTAGAAARTPAQARAVAERNVLRILGRNWNPRRIPELVNARTGLPRDNVQALCHPKPLARAGVFTCVVRPGDKNGKTRLYLRYKQLSPKHFVVHWLDLRH